MKKSVTSLADGRDLIYYDPDGTTPRSAVDQRPLGTTDTHSELRFDPLRDEWVVLASHRQSRTFLPPADQCPFCPSNDERLAEVPDSSYHVAVFENRFPSLSGARDVAPRADTKPPQTEPQAEELFACRAGRGTCEVVLFTDRHDASFGELTTEQARLVVEAWADRTAELGARDDVRQVFVFENRGEEIGATLTHPHGQIYAYPFVTPRTERLLASATAHRGRTGRNLFEDLLAAERADGSRVVRSGTHWTAFVPYAAHYPYEVHFYPHRRVPDLTALTDAERDEFCEIYLDLLRRFDRLFDGAPAPYVAAWHQAPTHPADVSERTEFALHLELYTFRRAPGKLKYLAGSESGMDVFINDVRPEDAAQRLRDLEDPKDTGGAADTGERSATR